MLSKQSHVTVLRRVKIVMSLVFIILFCLLTPLQFLTRFPDNPVVMILDLMKCGRCSNAELNEYTELLAHGLKKTAKYICGFCGGTMVAV